MLDEQQVAKLRLVLQTAGWNDVIRPLVLARGHEALKAIVVSPPERRGPMATVSDEDLRARIREAEWMVGIWPNLIAEYEHNSRLDELDSGTPATANP
jgi:hypothetical protein